MKSKANQRVTSDMDQMDSFIRSLIFSTTQDIFPCTPSDFTYEDLAIIAQIKEKVDNVNRMIDLHLEETEI